MENNEFVIGIDTKEALSINDIEKACHKWKAAHKKDFGYNTAQAALDSVLMDLRHTVLDKNRMISDKQTVKGELKHIDRDALLSDVKYVSNLIAQLLLENWTCEEINTHLSGLLPSTIAKAALKVDKENGDILHLSIEPNSGLEWIETTIKIERE